MRRFIAAALCALLTALVIPVSAQAPPALQASLDSYVADAPGTGIIVGVIDRGVVTVYRAGGTGTTRPLDEHTLFEIGSVTKTFTALLLAQDVLGGRVRLSDPVGKYLPPSVHVPSRDGKQITLLNLATQHSGLPRMPSNFAPKDPADPYADYTAADLYAFLDGYSLTRDPGASFEYSNLGVGLLGQALANQAHATYAQLVETRIFAPLHMEDSGLASLTPVQQSLFAVGHDEDGTPVHSWELAALAGAGGIRSSMHDMLAYLRANMGQRPLARACLFAQQPRDTIPTGRIGLIWWTDAPSGAIEHEGDTAGFHAMMAMTPDRAKGVVVLANGGDPAGIAGIAYQVLGIAAATIAPWEHVALSRDALEGYVGTYEVPGTSVDFTFELQGDTLMAKLTGQPFARIYPLGNDHFYYRVVPATYRFARDASGKVVALALFQNGTTVALRVDASGKPIGALPTSIYPATIAVDGTTLEEYVGVYSRGSAGAFTITKTASGLQAQLTGQAAYAIYPMAKDRFYYKVVDAELEFVRSANGNVLGVILHQNGRVWPIAPRERSADP